ncbi:MAG: MobQ family relaxase [Steroidobacteraceae bacterium]
MAIFHMDIKPVARGTGRTATAAAAYRAGERIRDERTGALYNHSKREDVLHKEIFLPSNLDRPDAGMEWARDRSKLWNTAEKAERQTNARVAREYGVALPAELKADQRVALARTFSREIADRYHVAVDLAIHAPRPEGDPRNFHAHLLATTREVTPEGLGPKTGLDMAGATRSELGLPPSRQEFRTLRARWAELTNEALRQANIEARVDHRTLEAQGIDREPGPQIPIAALKRERRGELSEVAGRIRERYRQRVAARNAKRAEKGADQATERFADGAAAEPESRRQSPPPQDMDARRRQAVEDWLKYHASPEGTARPPGAESSPPLSTDEIRRRAVEAWRGLKARGAESQRSASNNRDRDAGYDAVEAERGGDTSGLGNEFPE